MGYSRPQWLRLTGWVIPLAYASVPDRQGIGLGADAPAASPTSAPPSPPTP